MMIENDLEYYIWRTVGDAKVRDEHAEKDGQIFSIHDSPRPAEEFNCRCWAEPIKNKDGLKTKDKNTSDRDKIFSSTKLNKNLKSAIEGGFGKLNTNEVILRNERLKHIKDRHPEITDLVKANFKDVVNNPDYILKDFKNSDTVLNIKKLKENNNVLVVKLSLKDKAEHRGYKNSVITSYITSDKRIEALAKKLKSLYNKRGK